MCIEASFEMMSADRSARVITIPYSFPLLYILLIAMAKSLSQITGKIPNKFSRAW